MLKIAYGGGAFTDMTTRRHNPEQTLALLLLVLVPARARRQSAPKHQWCLPEIHVCTVHRLNHPGYL